MYIHAKLLLVTIGLLLPVACKEQQPAQQPVRKPATGNGTPTTDPFGNDANVNNNNNDNNNNNNNNSSNNDDDCFELTGKNGFGLASSYTYDDEIEDILDEYCLRCHDSSKYGDFSSYSKAKRASEDIGDKVDRDRMPPEDEPQLTSSARKKLLRWVEDGAPEDDSDLDNDSGNRDDCEDDKKDSDRDDDDAADDDEISDLDSGWDELLAEDEVGDCKEDGKIYDRTEKECHKADISESYSCTESGVKKAFKEIGIDVTSTLDDMEDDGYKLDQCGEDEGDPLVLFIKKTESDDTIGLKVRKLCKKGTSICD